MKRPRPDLRVLLVVALLVQGLASGCGLFHRGAEERAERPQPIDLNRASVRAVEALPGITPSMAARIVAGRPYDSPEALVERRILTPRELDRISDRIVVRDESKR